MPGLSLSVLGKEEDVSERHLARLFKRHLGKTFRQYLRETRINEAAVLLAQSRYEVKTIAGMVGYVYPSRFGRDFRLLMNCTPVEFRSKHAQERQIAPQHRIDLAMSDL
ncbi:MAG: helix-turn-helix transcriptional regulator [Bryobacteraceae bacterium]